MRCSKLPTPYTNCLDYFETTFLDSGIDHMGLCFDDGTNPTDEIVRTSWTWPTVWSKAEVQLPCIAKPAWDARGHLAARNSSGTADPVPIPQTARMGKKGRRGRDEAHAGGRGRNEGEKEKESADPVVPLQAATPPADEDKPMHDAGAARAVTPSPRAMGALPPVTPSRHFLEATAKAHAITTPGQPRKTPKRMAQDSDEEDGGGIEDGMMGGEDEEAEAADAVEDIEMDDLLPALGVATARKIKAVPRPRGHLGASVDRSERVTRSTAGAVNIRKAGTAVASAARGAGAAAPPASPVKVVKKTAMQAAGRAGNSSGPNKIPRLATTRTTAAAAKALGGATAATGTTGTATGKEPAVVRARPAPPTTGAASRPVRKAAAAAGTGAARAGLGPPPAATPTAAPPSTPSRLPLPTLLKRPSPCAAHANSPSEVANLALEQKRAAAAISVFIPMPMPGTPGGPLGTNSNGGTDASSPDAWVANNVAVAAVMLPASQSGERPGSRSSVRRRRSSFSSADVMT
ncbi:hypothetical protein D9619_000353 [Psilocybe cf. subviscida]|uniref:Uncharacterized protein n=1 Tax=Psilocybe cf. subviscida TaxID=2480587 RepID=A0A8H5BG67_9AGAR|nr:hypothetical protein D9619_000353 [Psilocybe cf. subviscida]